MTSGDDRQARALPSGAAAPLLTAGAIGLLAAVVLGALFSGQTTGSRVDRWAAARLELPTGSAPVRYPLSLLLQGLADPVPASFFVVALVIACLWRGYGRLAVVAVVATFVTDLSVIIAKHIVGRTIHGGSLTYPSTHAAHSAVVAMVSALLVANLAQSGPRVSVLLVLGAALAAATVMGWSLVAGSVHYATDVVGGISVALFVLPTVACGADLVGDRI